MADIAAPPDAFDIDTETLIVGAGACGMVAALAAYEAGQDVLVIEADAVPSGSTALSAGLIPAAGTRMQAAAGIEDSAAQFATDIQGNGRRVAGVARSLAAPHFVTRFAIVGDERPFPRKDR